MQIPMIQFAAEFEQAAAASVVMDQASTNGVWGAAAHRAVFERFGHAGEDLPFEYQNELYAWEGGQPPVGVLLH